jgi:PTS system sucrose-specific IIC component
MVDYDKSAKQVLDNIGGKDNVQSATHCITRLRLILKDESLADNEKLENIDGVQGVIYNSGQLQIIFGTGVVEKAYDAFTKVSGAKEVSVSEIKNEGSKKTGKLQQMFRVFADIFIPIIPAFIVAAMILGVRSILTTPMLGMSGSFADNSILVRDFASFLNVIATTFKYLPVLVMYSATKRFGGNPILGLLVGFVMIHPELADRNAVVLGQVHPHYWDLFGLKIAQVGFQGGVFPAILTSWFLAKVQKFVDKYSPQVLAYILVPSITLLVANLSLFLVFGPLGIWVGNVLGGIINFLYMKMGVLGAFVFAGGLQPLVVTGTQHAIQGIEANLIATTGFDYIQPIWSVSIIAQGGGCIGLYMLLKQKSKDRDIAVSSFIPTLVGISEPAIFAVNLKYGIAPFVCSFLGAGFGGAFMKLFNVKGLAQGLTVLPGLTVGRPFTPYVIGNIIAFVLPIIFILAYDGFKKILPEDKRRVDSRKDTINVEGVSTQVVAPVDGKIIPLEEVDDPTFAKKLVGDGFAIEPENGNIYSPINGVVESIFPTKHALTLKTDSGISILIHMGIDTVALNGEGFDIPVKEGQKITIGDQLATVDLNYLVEAGKKITIIVLFPEYKQDIQVGKQNEIINRGSYVMDLS